MYFSFTKGPIRIEEGREHPADELHRGPWLSELYSAARRSSTKIANLQAHSTSWCDELWACASAVIRAQAIGLHRRVPGRSLGPKSSPSQVHMNMCLPTSEKTNKRKRTSHKIIFPLFVRINVLLCHKGEMNVELPKESQRASEELSDELAVVGQHDYVREIGFGFCSACSH